MTVNDVFETTMSFIDERLDSGLIDATSTAVFKKNAPLILTTIQDELIPDCNYFKTSTTTKVATTTAGNYYPVTMPSDFYSASQIISIETDGNYELDSNVKWEANNIMLVPDGFVGTIKVVYRPIPATLVDLTSPLVLDDMTCRTTMAYGLASRLLTNENRTMANYFNSLYNESRALLRSNHRILATTDIMNETDDMSY